MAPDLLDARGGLMRRSGESLRDGSIPMSGSPPIVRDPDRVLGRLRRQGPELVHANHVAEAGD